MKKSLKLKICDWSLLALTATILASGIQLEATDGTPAWTVWLHIAIGVPFMALSGWHIWLHFGKSNWFTRFHRQKSRLTRILWWATLATLASGIIATAHSLGSFTHGHIGGVHGKLGFLMIILSVCHIVARIRFFRPGHRLKTFMHAPPKSSVPQHATQANDIQLTSEQHYQPYILQIS